MAKFIAYRGRSGLMRAKIIRRHRNGDMTVEPWFWLGEHGRDEGPFQGGFKVRLRPADQLPVPPH